MKIFLPAAAAAALLALGLPSMAAGPAAIACPAGGVLTRLDAPLPRLAARLAGSEPVRIVAIGSSSTAGAGATSRETAYPSRLEAALRERFPGRSITVVNRGINGQDGPEMLARFDTDVAALQPTLVIWQGGVNALFRDNGLSTAETILRQAIARTRTLGADFLLIDPQYAPRVLADSDTAAMVALQNSVAHAEGVPVFHRFALMQNWHERAGMAFEAFLAKDNFHMNDWSYDCLARDLAQSIMASVNAQQRTADAQPPAVRAATVAKSAAVTAAPAAPAAAPPQVAPPADL
ncbi:SGNH/GDSL hydrolase family protein [Ancylobacter terrae]|uniref:SGNH/GDSL hydrolase family protein n=1 Tax=Ancylobacter sp. sgz301288 TaxID=3342077 RepID=UPI00385EF763